MSTAEELRAAARLMRERAAAAYDARAAWDASPHGDVHGVNGVWICDSATGEHAEHIASWHPAVALAVADQLDAMAAVVEEAGDGPLALVAAGLAEKSLTVARTYLGAT